MSHFKRFTIAFAAMAIWGSSFGAPMAWAQDAGKSGAGLIVRVVDIDAIRNESTALKAASDKLQKYSTSRTEALQAEDKALRDANAELNRKRTLLAPEAFAAERSKFEQRVADFQGKMQEQQKQLNTLQAEAIGEINQKIVQIITEYAEQNNVSLILPSQSVLLSANSMSINAYVLERLNKELPSVTVALPSK